MALNRSDMTSYTAFYSPYLLLYFVYRTIDYDIALLKLRRPAMVNDYVNTVCVPGENEIIPVNSKCYMTGKNIHLFIYDASFF